MSAVLSPKQLAEAIGVSESSMKRWIDSGQIHAARTLGGHRKIMRGEALRFIRETGASIVRPEMLGLGDLSAIPGGVPSPGARTDALLAALMDGKAQEARGLVLAMYLSGVPLGEIFDGPIRASLEDLGTLWTCEKDGIFKEHRATDICFQAINQVRLLITPAQDAPHAVGGAVAGDVYAIPSLMASTVLASCGFDSISLGADTPASALISAMREESAQLVWMSISVADDPHAVQHEIERVVTEAEQRGAALVIGGANRHVIGPKLSGRCTVCGSMAELKAFADGLLSKRS